MGRQMQDLDRPFAALLQQRAGLEGGVEQHQGIVVKGGEPAQLLLGHRQGHQAVRKVAGPRQERPALLAGGGLRRQVCQGQGGGDRQGEAIHYRAALHRQGGEGNPLQATIQRQQQGVDALATQLGQHRIDQQPRQFATGCPVLQIVLLAELPLERLDSLLQPGQGEPCLPAADLAFAGDQNMVDLNIRLPRDRCRGDLEDRRHMIRLRGSRRPSLPVCLR